MSAALPEAIHVYGGVSSTMWTLTHRRPVTWEEGQAIARLLADGGEFKIAALFPAGVALRRETVPSRSADNPTVLREEKFPCTRMMVEPIAPAPKSVAVQSPAPPTAPAASGDRVAVVAGGLFDSAADW